MSEYTPTTEHIRQYYSHFPPGRFSDYGTVREDRARAEFDRWIAAHDAEVEKAVRDRVADEIDAEADEIDAAFASSGLLGELEDETRGMRKAAKVAREGGIH